MLAGVLTLWAHAACQLALCHDAALLPIQLLFWPTYAPWLTPIEQLGPWLKQTVIHLHRSSDDWPALQQRGLAFLPPFEHGSPPLRRYVGLLPD